MAAFICWVKEKAAGTAACILVMLKAAWAFEKVGSLQPGSSYSTACLMVTVCVLVWPS
jgi:hypothetical protein